MSSSITFYSTIAFSVDELKEYVISFDVDNSLESNYWIKEINYRINASWNESMKRGIIFNDSIGVAIYIDYDDYFELESFIEFYEDEKAYFKEILDKLGGYPKTSVEIQVGHTKGSGKLALRFAEKLSEKWNGIIDWRGSGTSPEILEIE